MPKPQREQLKEVIKNGDDSKNKRLILKENGEFELIYDLEKVSPSEMDYVTRWETFDAGNDYVGKEAAEDDEFIDRTMSWAEHAWEKYQKTGDIHITNLTI